MNTRTAAALPALPLPALLLLALTALRCLVAARVPLAPDEAYYWVWSRALQPGYLDHPPAVALWIRAGTALAGDTAGGVRLLGPLAAAAGSVLLADATARLAGSRAAGLVAATLLNATLMVGAGSVLMTPDTPLLFFATLALWAAVRAATRRAWWLLAGVAAGLACDSKYTGLLVGLALPLCLALQRQWRGFRSPFLWAGGALAAAAVAPVLWWNAAHGWVSLLKQGGRTGDWRPERAAQFVAELLGGQLALATPPIAAAFAAGLWHAAARARRGDKAGAVPIAFAAPGLLIFAQHALGDRVQGNWLAVLYPPLAVAAACWRPRWWRAAAACGFALTVAAYGQAATGALALPRALDPTLRLAGWDRLATEADGVRRRLSLAALAADDYAVAAELAWWAPPGTAVLGAEPRWRLFALPRATPGDVLLVRSARRAEAPDPARGAGPEPVATLSRGRDGVEAERFLLYRAHLNDGDIAATLPRPDGGAE